MKEVKGVGISQLPAQIRRYIHDWMMMMTMRMAITKMMMTMIMMIIVIMMMIMTMRKGGAGLVQAGTKVDG